MEFFRRLSSGSAESGGTQVEQPGLLVGERPGAATIIQAMNEYGIDMSHNKRRQLTPEGLDTFDKIIIMAEPETVPTWLSEHSSVEYWDVLDIKGQSTEVVRLLRDQILDHVGNMLGTSDRDSLIATIRKSA